MNLHNAHEDESTEDEQNAVPLAPPARILGLQINNRASAALLDGCRKHNALLATTALALAAFVAPGPGAAAYGTLNQLLIVLLFLILGLTLGLAELGRGLAAVHVHLMCQVQNANIFVHKRETCANP
eukprot:2249678-Pyramimonas_sp.AAC.1